MDDLNRSADHLDHLDDVVDHLADHLDHLVDHLADHSDHLAEHLAEHLDHLVDHLDHLAQLAPGTTGNQLI